MLGKLIKHEFKETYKTFLMLYVAILFLSVVNSGSFVYDCLYIVCILFVHYFTGFDSDTIL